MLSEYVDFREALNEVQKLLHYHQFWFEPEKPEGLDKLVSSRAKK